ncbi:MAG: hypothetical protein A2W09_01525 [Deltaproteobacteria bacterium RBG_16_50_11]|nr:MAG: hypothetical protein A2W09_01525 [Deltaproteobacteria bacterium RBG_16_50_11]
MKRDFVGSAHRSVRTRDPLPTGRQAQRDSPTFLNGLRTRITGTDTLFQSSLMRHWANRSLKSNSISRILIFPTNLFSLINPKLSWGVLEINKVFPVFFDGGDCIFGRERQK